MDARVQLNLSAAMGVWMSGGAMSSIVRIERLVSPGREELLVVTLETA